MSEGATVISHNTSINILKNYYICVLVVTFASKRNTKLNKSHFCDFFKRHHCIHEIILYNTSLNSGRLIGCLWSHDIKKFPISQECNGIRSTALPGEQ